MTPADQSPPTTDAANQGMDLLDALQARTGIVCFAGAGGKKASMVRLAQRHPGRVGLTTTIRVPFRLKRDSEDLIALPETTTADEAIARLAGQRVVGYAGPKTRSYRLLGIDPDMIAEIHGTGGFDATYVKVDGARMRVAKGHKDGEPILVPGTTVVLLFASVHAIGLTLNEDNVHRPDVFADWAGARLGEAITPRHLASTVVRQVDLIKAVGAPRVVPVINMADDDNLVALAQETADKIWHASPSLERLAITAMIQPEPLKGLLLR